jgi:septal ring factor EnvC (AmiA/AmiB activator)
MPLPHVESILEFERYDAPSADPQRAFDLEPNLDALQDIQQLVIEAYFSMPDGGLEVGGVLLGNLSFGRLTITGSLPFVSEHSMGRHYVLSDKDQRHFANMLAAARLDPESKPIGWYRSQIRDGICLTDSDLDLHARFFPEPDRIVLVLKPSVFSATRCGFFARKADGSMQADSPVQEFELARPPHQDKVASMPAKPSIEPMPSKRLQTSDSAVRLGSLPAVPEPVPVATENRWTSKVGGWLRSSRPREEGSVGLRVSDERGELQIRWKPDASAVQRSLQATLMIGESGTQQCFELAEAHLQSGAFTYLRRTERVEVVLSLVQPDGRDCRISTIFVDALAGTAATHQRWQIECEKLQWNVADLNAEVSRQVAQHLTLEQEVAGLREERARLNGALTQEMSHSNELGEKAAQANAALARKLDEIARVEAELLHLREETARLNSALHEEKGSRCDLEHELAASVRANGNLELAYAQAMTENHGIRVELVRLQQDLAGEVTRSDAENQRLCSAIAAARQQSANLETALASQSERALDAERELAELREQNRKLADRTSKHAQLETELAALREENQKLTVAVAVEAERKHSAQRQVAELREEQDRLQSDLALEKERNLRSARDLQDLRAAWVDDRRHQTRDLRVR